MSLREPRRYLISWQKARLIFAHNTSKMLQNATNGTTYWVLQPSTENFFENDIVLSDEQMDIILR